MQILRTDYVGYEEAAEKAALILRAGGSVLYPTDTVYGLAVDATNASALERLAALKGRDPGKTPLVAVPDRAVIERFGQMNERANALAARFLPGPLTLVLKATSSCPSGVVRDDGTVGVRIPDDQFCQALSAAFGRAYTSTSANLAGEATAASIREILEQFGSAQEAIALAIDDGPREGNMPSTIVSCVTDVPEILREGALSREALGL